MASDIGAVDARAVLAAEVRNVDRPVFGEDARMPARQRRGQLFGVGNEWCLGPADGEQVLADADLAQLRTGDGRQQNIELLTHPHRHFHDQCIVRSHVSKKPTAQP